jgi:acyl carrier protein
MNAQMLIAEIVRRPAVADAAGTLLAEIEGWDSLKGVRLVLRMQELVGRELSEDEIAGLHSVADVDRILESARGS